MRHRVKYRSCPCRSVGECTHHFAKIEDEARALDRLVNAFAKEMKRKLHDKLRRDGRAGWDDESWTPERIAMALVDHVSKGDPIDVANFCAFLWNRGDDAARAALANEVAGHCCSCAVLGETCGECMEGE